jgi:hypothetical protein
MKMVLMVLVFPSRHLRGIIDLRTFNYLNGGKMELPVKTRIPMEIDYILLLGQTVQTYARYEGTIVELIDKYRGGFREGYYLKFSYNPAELKKELRKIYNKLPNGKERIAIDRVFNGFSNAVDVRNGLFHSSTCTSEDNQQVLLHQTGNLNPSNPSQKRGRECSCICFDYATLKGLLEEMTENYYDASHLFEFKRGHYDSPLR